MRIQANMFIYVKSCMKENLPTEKSYTIGKVF